jgi:O-acetyl-ADP-ribose deacetylase (regulator of RNase III)
MEKQGYEEPTGRAKITPAYNLPCKYVIHTVGPAIPQGSLPSQVDCDLLASCYRSCLELADYNNLKSIAFCCISTGVFNFPQRDAAEIAVNTVNEYLDSKESTSLECVIFNVFSDESYLTYKDLLFGDIRE